jgi:hypothetical protein
MRRGRPGTTVVASALSEPVVFGSLGRPSQLASVLPAGARHDSPPTNHVAITAAPRRSSETRAKEWLAVLDQ